MIRWNYIAKKLADKYSSPQFGGRWNPEHLMRCWRSLFDSEPQNHADKQTMSGNYAIVYSFIMTIASDSGTSNETKAENILRLIREIAHAVDQDEFEKIFKDGGYEINVSQPEVTELSKHGKFHSEIVNHCEKLFKQGHFTTCVNEATKAYNKAVQKKAKTTRDGQDLMLWAFADKGPLRINRYTTESEINEQEGIKFLSAGVMRGFRNPTSHEPALSWKMSKDDSIEILSLVSFLFKQLDKATVLP